MNKSIKLLLGVFFLLSSKLALTAYRDDALAESFNFAAVGDWDDDRESIKTAQNIDNKQAEVVLGLGDYAYEESSDDILSWWKNIEMVYDDEIFKGALGNHDVRNDNIYLSLFNQSSWTYSFVYNDVLFVAMNTEDEAIDEVQKEEVIGILENHTETSWKVVFMHRPVLTSPTEHQAMSDADEYCQIFQEYGVNLVLQAHNHNYQRSSVLDCIDTEFVKSNDNEGFTVVTVGTGGRTAHTLKGHSSLIEVQDDNKYGFLNVEVINSTQMNAQFVDNGGEVIDSFLLTTRH